MTSTPDELLITVRPGAHGWMLCRHAAPPVQFASGAEAERSARHLAEALARTGLTVVMEILLRDGRLGGRLRFGREGCRDAAASASELELA
jgi:hypothetical protein